MRLAEEREEKAISKDLAKLRKLPPKEPEVPIAPEFLLEPEGDPSELEGVFQLPLETQAEFSLIPDDPFWPLPSKSPSAILGTVVEASSSLQG